MSEEPELGALVRSLARSVEALGAQQRAQAQEAHFELRKLGKRLDAAVADGDPSGRCSSRMSQSEGSSSGRYGAIAHHRSDRRTAGGSYIDELTRVRNPRASHLEVDDEDDLEQPLKEASFKDRMKQMASKVVSKVATPPSRRHRTSQLPRAPPPRRPPPPRA